MDIDRYRKGFQTITDFNYHFVGKTKYGHSTLQGEIALRLRDIIREICIQHKMDVIRGNIRSNHVQVFIGAPAYFSPAKVLQYIKGKISYRIQREFLRLRNRYWGSKQIE